MQEGVGLNNGLIEELERLVLYPQYGEYSGYCIYNRTITFDEAVAIYMAESHLYEPRVIDLNGQDDYILI